MIAPFGVLNFSDLTKVSEGRPVNIQNFTGGADLVLMEFVDVFKSLSSVVSQLVAQGRYC